MENTFTDCLCDEMQSSEDDMLAKRSSNGNSKKSNDKNLHNKKVGFKGEKAAANYLLSKGYEIIERNWTCNFGEADIIAKDNDVLVFVEVKTRSNINRGLPEDAVGAKKRKKYECIAALYLRESDFVDIPVRFDVIAILIVSEDKAMIRHHVNAFGVV